MQWRQNEFESGGGHRLGPKVGAQVRRERQQKNFFWSCPFTFLAQKVQLVVLVSSFVMVSTVWSVSCLLLFYSQCRPCPAIGNSGGTSPTRAPWSRRHCVCFVYILGFFIRAQCCRHHRLCCELAAMLCRLEGNRRSGVALAVRDTQTFGLYYLRAKKA